MALSAIYRTGQRFGAGYVIDHLRGVLSDRAHGQGHDKLSTHGIGKELTVKQWQSVVRQLIALDYIRVDPAYGGLRLTRHCRALLKGTETLELRMDRKKKKERQAARKDLPPIEIEDEPLWEALRDLRMRLAKEQDVPPFVIFHDTTLRAMLAHRPEKLEEMARVHGVGEKKLDVYGEAFCELIAQYSS